MTPLLQGLPMNVTDQHPEPVAQQDNEISDGSLLRRLRVGSEDAATQLYLRYAHRLRGLVKAQSSPELARRVDAEELVQSIFGSFFRGAGSGYYDVPIGEELWKLFLVIALNKIRAKGNFHRAAKRDVRRTTEADAGEAWGELPEKQDTAELAFLRLTVEEAMERLLPQHRQVVTLRIEGHEVAEIARQTGRSMRTVERLLQEARKQLAYLLQES
jgi:RNA polymerase sigma-70 factor (ECF subfamily)